MPKTLEAEKAAGPALPAAERRAFYRTVAGLVIPMALQNLINVGVQSADVLMLGRVGEAAISAASLAGQVQFVMMLILFGLVSGASVLTAQYWGRGDTRAIEKVLAIVTRLAFAVALCFFAAAEAMPRVLMGIFTPSEEIIARGAVYLRILAPSFLIIAFTNTYLNVMRSVERVLVSTVVYFISLIVNVLLNMVFIFGAFGVPAMGVAGAALATTLARTVELGLVAAYAVRNRVVRLRPGDFLRRHGALSSDFFKYAGPTTLNEMLWGMAISANAVIIGHLGVAVVAANSVTQVVRQLAMVVTFGVAGAAAILIGKTLGGGEPKKAEEYGRRMLRLAAGTGLAGCLLVLAVRPLVLWAMNLSPEAGGYLSYLLLLMAAYVVAQGVNTVLIVGVFRGGGDTRFGLFLDAGTMWGFSILLAALAAFVFRWPVQAVLLIIFCDEYVKIPLCLWRYRGRHWLRNVTRDDV